MSSPSHQVREVTVESRPVAGVRANVRRGRVGFEFGPYLEQVYAAGRSGAVEPLETPRGIAATTTHFGDYGRMSEANAAILEWCRANNRKLAGPSWEVYGHWTPDPSQLRTDVYYLLRDNGSAG
jgi:hypothetical protein